jgi:hypothetical protein
LKMVEENAAAHAKLEKAPIVIADNMGAPKVPAPATDDGSVPF